MAKPVLDGLDVVAGTHGVTGEGVAQCVRGDARGEASGSTGNAHLFSDSFIGSVPTVLSANDGGREQPLPAEFAGSVFVFHGKPTRQLNEAVAIGEVNIMERLAPGEMPLQCRHERRRQDRQPRFVRPCRHGRQ